MGLMEKIALCLLCLISLRNLRVWVWEVKYCWRIVNLKKPLDSYEIVREKSEFFCQCDAHEPVPWPFFAWFWLELREFGFEKHNSHWVLLRSGFWDCAWEVSSLKSYKSSHWKRRWKKEKRKYRDCVKLLLIELPKHTGVYNLKGVPKILYIRYCT